MRRALCCALLAALALLGAAPAQAHKPSDSYLLLEVSGRQVSGQWDIALRDLDFALGLDADGDGNLTWDEIRRRHAAIAAYALARLELATGDGPCTLAAGEQLVDRHTDGAYSVLRFDAICPGPVAALTVAYRLFADIDPQHRGLARVVHGAHTVAAIFGPDHARQTLQLQAPGHIAQLADYAREGVWHIWIGFDHILFLLSLLLPAVLVPSAPTAQALKIASIDVLKVVTAFTLAHSLTLTLASLHLLALPARWVESAIAASVAAAAMNNLVPLFRGHRPAVAFAFGLVHGMGFAGVLADLGLPRSSLALSLFGFNAGVELGQLAIVAAFLPLAFLLRSTRLYRWILRTGSALIVVVALLWLVERAFDLKIMVVASGIVGRGCVVDADVPQRAPSLGMTFPGLREEPKKIALHSKRYFFVTAIRTPEHLRYDCSRWRRTTRSVGLKYAASRSAMYTDRCCPPVHPSATVR
jgi:hypothetical protein